MTIKPERAELLMPTFPVNGPPWYSALLRVAVSNKHLRLFQRKRIHKWNVSRLGCFQEAEPSLRKVHRQELPDSDTQSVSTTLSEWA